jgi:hypothetical protein
VAQYDKDEPSENMEWIDYGLGGMSALALDLVGDDVTELAVLQRELAIRGLLFGFEATHRFYEIGTPGRLRETETFFMECGRDPAE